MNFLAEVLSSADEMQVLNVKEKTPKLLTLIAKLKCELKNYLSNSYIDLNIMKEKGNNLLKKAKKLNEEMENINKQIESTKNTVANESDLENLKSDLEESMYTLSVINQLIEIDTQLKAAKEFFSNKQYFEATKIIHKIKETLEHRSPEDSLDIIQGIMIAVTIEDEMILNETSKILSETLQTDKTVKDDDINFSLKVNNSLLNDLHESLQVMFYANSLIFGLQCLSNFLLEIFTYLINNKCDVEIIEEEQHSKLNICVNKKSTKMHYSQVFNNITKTIQFIEKKFNFEIKEELYLLSYIGQKISEQFCEQLIKNCLVDTVPTTAEELEKYEVIKKAIESLQKVLTDSYFLSEDNQSLLDYACNVDVHFVNKICQLYLDQARNILKKDLHDMLEVGTEVTDNPESEGHFFPKCLVSRNVIDYLDLINTIVNQIKTSSELSSGRLFYTIEQVITLYYKLVPEYHKKLLNTIPQQVALFYNNCNYIAYQLVNLKKKYENDEKLNQIIKEHIFVTHIQLLKSTGSELFLTHMRLQITQIEDILKDSDFPKIQYKEKINENSEKSIRQCLRQLELLKTVWQKVLTNRLYNKTLGELLNSFVALLIKYVTDVTDLSSENCTVLIELFTIVQNRGPKLFTEPKEIHMYVKLWYKFNELIIFLNSSLIDVNDRWADGKGPLAVEFTREEIKGLIRAVFQNTDRRAAILARIN